MTLIVTSWTVVTIIHWSVNSM